MLRSVAAVTAGFAAVFLVVMAGTVLAARMLSEPGAELSVSYLFANIVVSAGAALLGGIVVSRLAPRRPRSHAAALAALMALLALPGLFAPASGQPTFYPIGMLLVGVTGVVLGAMWMESKRPA